MIFFRRVSGESMKPALRDGQAIVGVTGSDVLVGNIVVVAHAGKELIKRVIHIDKNKVWIEGDNVSHSTDSRHFGWIAKSDILGTMKYTLPIAQDPPKLRTKQGPIFGWIAAVILIVFSLVHLFRIDTFVPELSLALGSNQTLTLWVASILVSMEVFALPFLMRMRLSPLAQYVSGAFAVIVPLVWLLISIWTFGTNSSTAQLGEFVSLPSSWVLILTNLLWLVFSYYTIWALGYDHRANEKQSFLNKWLNRLSK
jgi:nickel-type superoxide dismutase maturation protease